MLFSIFFCILQFDFINNRSVTYKTCALAASPHFIEVFLFYQGANMNGVSISALGFLFFAIVQLDSMSCKPPSLNSTNNLNNNFRASQGIYHLVVTQSFRSLQGTQSSKTTTYASRASQVQYHLVVTPSFPGTQSIKPTSVPIGMKSVQFYTIATMEPEEKKTAVSLLLGNVGRDMISSRLSTSLEDKQSSKSLGLKKDSSVLETKDKNSPGNKISRKRRSKDVKKCPRSCTCKSCSNDVKGIAMKCKTDDLKKFLRKLKIPKSKIYSL